MTTPSCLFAALIVCLPSFVYARQVNNQVGAAAPSEKALPAGAEGLIHLDVVVTDKPGKPISGLEPKDFALLDNGQPNRILSFQAFDSITARPDPPVEVILLVDTLGLPAQLASHEQEEVERFLRQNGGHLSQPVLIFELSGSGLWTVAKPSSDGNILAAEIAQNREVCLMCPTLNSMRGESFASFALEESPGVSALKVLGYMATAERRKPGRKLLLWVGPGWGIGSGAYLENIPPGQHLFDMIYWFSTLLREARIALYSFSVGEAEPRSLLYTDYLGGVKSARQATFIHLYRKVLAVQTGGSVLPPSNDLVSQMDTCLQEASVFYTLSFDPSLADHPDEYHGLKVQVAKPGLTARTSTGYYDQPYYSDQSDPAVKPVTVEQLEQTLKAIRDQSDGESARQLSALQLTERLSSVKLSLWESALHGDKARQALVGLADASAFLDPPPAEMPADAPPDPIAQRRMISLAVEYLNKTILKLPNFYATRTTVRYAETPKYDEGSTKIRHQPLHAADRSRETVLYRNGYETVDSAAAKRKKQKAEDRYLITYGTFGPILGAVMDMIVPSGLVWRHWEEGASGPRAVFRYAFPPEKSLYQVGGCCLPDGDGTIAFRKLAGYHGEITIDPASGAILRLTLQANLKSTTPLVRSDIMVEYGQVEIGGKSYICPVRSVSISRARSVIVLTEWDESFRTFGPYATMLDDITYDGYHMFRADSRLLPGFNR